MTAGGRATSPRWIWECCSVPDTVVWDLVAYIHSISQDPDKAFGKVYSVDEFANGIEQVPAEKLQSAAPWKMTEPFKNGQKP